MTRAEGGHFTNGAPRRPKNLCLLIEIFKLFTFSVITDVLGFNLPSCYLSFISLVCYSSFSAFFLLSFSFFNYAICLLCCLIRCNAFLGYFGDCFGVYPWGCVLSSDVMPSPCSRSPATPYFHFALPALVSVALGLTSSCDLSPTTRCCNFLL